MKNATFLKKIEELFTVNKYYRMSDEELELEANKYKIGGYFDGRRIIRDEVIKQLLRKDQANDSRIAIGISLASFFIAGISLLFTFVNLPSVIKQTYSEAAQFGGIKSENEIKTSQGTTCSEGHSSEMCWDGSEVRRVEPSCEFSPCPDLPQQEEWHEYSSEKSGFSLRYPLKKYVFWKPVPLEQVGVETVEFMNSCVYIATVPNTTKKTKEFSDDIRSFIFSNEVKALREGETAKKEVQGKSEGTVVTYSYTRLADKVIDGVVWNAFQWGSTWEMHASEVHYTQTFGQVSYVLVVREGGVCPTVGPEEVINTFRVGDQRADDDNSSVYMSKAGYSFNIPDGFRPDSRQEHIENDNCVMGFSGGARWSLVKVVPYHGEKLKDYMLANYSLSTYQLSYQDKKIDGIDSLVIEAGPVGDSGSGTNVIIPQQDNALIFLLDRVSMDSQIVNLILESVKINNLDISNCGMV